MPFTEPDGCARYLAENVVNLTALKRDCHAPPVQESLRYRASESADLRTLADKARSAWYHDQCRQCSRDNRGRDHFYVTRPINYPKLRYPTSLMMS